MPPTIQSVALKCRNFKCFGPQEQGFETIKPFNIIIGRNNSGKSSLLDLVNQAIAFRDVAGRGHKGEGSSSFSISWMPTESEINDILQPANRALSDDMTLNENSYSERFRPLAFATRVLPGKKLVKRFASNVDFNELHFEISDYVPLEISMESRKVAVVVHALRNIFPNPFSEHVFRRILADRDIVPEPSNAKLQIMPNGGGVTNIIQRYLNVVGHDRSLIENVFLPELNKILLPDVNYSRIVAKQSSEDQNWEIYLDEPSKGLLPMSEMGSGVKTVLLVLANLLIAPLIESGPHPLSKFIFAFEELENNLHPAVQRRLFRYLRCRALADKFHVFITTHSSVVIDLFSADPESQILHVTHDGQSATVEAVSGTAKGFRILDDLDVCASDVLQTNAIVWVEGPSDRIYFRRWIELWSDRKLIEGIHFQCVPFGGSVNAHLSFDLPEDVEEMIAAMKINRNAILLIDSDRREDSQPLKLHTQRLVDEIKRDGHAWLTAGKEVENYIPAKAFQSLFNLPSLIGPGQFSDVLAYYAKYNKSAKPKKVPLAHDVVPLLSRDDLERTLDMAQHLTEICDRIRKWNRIE